MRKIACPVLLIVVLLLFSGCRNPKEWFYSRYLDPVNYYIVGDAEQKKQLRSLFEDADLYKGEYENSLAVIQQIIRLLHNSGYKEKLNLFLTAYVENNPDDPYDSYYLLIVAENYSEEGAYPFAAHYYDRILKNYPDLIVQGKSVHYVCLKQLINLVEEPEIRVNYYKELIARFSEPDQLYSNMELIDKGPLYYYLAKTYEELGEWELAVQAYRNFLLYPDCKIPGVPKAHSEIAEMIAFYDYRDKSWIMDNLEDLTKYVQWAIWGRNPSRLNRYRAKVNFFAIAWEEDQNAEKSEKAIDDLNQFYSDLGIFMTSRLRCENTLDSDSNLQEAYLKTWGWSYRIPTWYLYFRKISFPADPEINGKWEWAGIYLGEKPFAGKSDDN